MSFMQPASTHLKAYMEGQSQNTNYFLDMPKFEP